MDMVEAVQDPEWFFEVRLVNRSGYRTLRVVSVFAGDLPTAQARATGIVNSEKEPGQSGSIHQIDEERFYQFPEWQRYYVD